MSSTVRLAIIGCGQRGRVYSEGCASHPSLGRVVATADPVAIRRSRIAESWSLPDAAQFASHSAFFEACDAGLEVDAVVVGVMDALHREVVVEACKRKLHILCEKPLATSVKDCVEMYKAVSEAGIVFAVGHVLRYSPYNMQLKLIIESGILGQVISIQHMEPVGWDHFAHSFVRGNWRREQDTSFVLMTKSCHDIDILNFLMGGVMVAKVSSFGNLTHFRRDQKPKEAGDATRCLDCSYEPSCPYSARRQYLEPLSHDPPKTGWPVSVLTDVVDIENVTQALRDGPYGKCVYETDNDVCDHQVVNLEFTDGRTASFTMVAFSWDLCIRKTRIFGNRGEVQADGDSIVVTHFVSRTRDTYRPYVDGVVAPGVRRESTQINGGVQHQGEGFDVAQGHGGGDEGLLVSFLKSVAEGEDYVRCPVAECLESHLWVFAAEEARKQSRVVNMAEFKHRHGLQA